MDSIANLDVKDISEGIANSYFKKEIIIKKILDNVSTTIFLKNFRMLELKNLNLLTGKIFVLVCSNLNDLYICRTHFRSKHPNLENLYIKYDGSNEILDLNLKTFIRYLSYEKNIDKAYMSSFIDSNDRALNAFKSILNISNEQIFFQQSNFDYKILKILISFNRNFIECGEDNFNISPNLMLLGGSCEEISKKISTEKMCHKFMICIDSNASSGPNYLNSYLMSQNVIFNIKSILNLSSGGINKSIYWVEKI